MEAPSVNFNTRSHANSPMLYGSPIPMLAQLPLVERYLADGKTRKELERYQLSLLRVFNHQRLLLVRIGNLAVESLESDVRNTQPRRVYTVTGNPSATLAVHPILRDFPFFAATGCLHTKRLRESHS